MKRPSGREDGSKSANKSKPPEHGAVRPQHASEKEEARPSPPDAPMTAAEYRTAARIAVLWELDPKKAEEFERLAREAEGPAEAHPAPGRPRTTGGRARRR